jgi:nucleotide-binding universal stress UspA family protein
MGKILCAIRGGGEGYRTQDAAAGLARDRGDELVFLMVLETSSLSKASGSGGMDMRGTLTRMGNSILFNAAERARQLGVAARTLLREGNPREQIKVAAREEGATIVVLGRPQGRHDKFSQAELESFARDITTETGAEVQVL